MGENTSLGCQLTAEECDLCMKIMCQLFYNMKEIPDTSYLITGSSMIFDKKRGADMVFDSLYEKVKTIRHSFDKEAGS